VIVGVYDSGIVMQRVWSSHRDDYLLFDAAKNTNAQTGVVIQIGIVLSIPSAVGSWVVLAGRRSRHNHVAQINSDVCEL
jgi:hypothetical protein